MSQVTDRIAADVAQLNTVSQSVVTLLNNLAQQIRDNQEDPAALAQIADDIEANTTALAQAVAANTPVSGAPQA